MDHAAHRDSRMRARGSCGASRGRCRSGTGRMGTPCWMERRGPFLERQSVPSGSGSLAACRGRRRGRRAHSSRQARASPGGGHGVDVTKATQRMIQPMRGTRRSSILATIRKVRGRTAKNERDVNGAEVVENDDAGGRLPGFSSPPPPTGRPRPQQAAGPLRMTAPAGGHRRVKRPRRRRSKEPEPDQEGEDVSCGLRRLKAEG